MRPLERQGFFSCWDETMVMAGAAVDEQRRRHLLDADVVVIFASADLLADDRLYEGSLSQQIRRLGDKVKLLLVRPCLLDQVSALADLRPFNKAPLAGVLPRSRQDLLLRDFVLTLVELLPGPSRGAARQALVPGQRRSLLGPLMLAAGVLGAGVSLWSRSAKEMIFLSGTTFQMGSPPEQTLRVLWQCQQASGKACSESAYTWEQPLHSVTLSPFWLDRLEVTNQRFATWLHARVGPAGQRDGLVMEKDRLTGEDIVLIDLRGPAPGILCDARGCRAAAGREELPVTQVSWSAVVSYCAAQGKRLPTEAEWEFAARERQQRSYPWGEEAPRCDGVAYGRYPSGPCSGQGPRPVGRSGQDRTAEGVMDLGGNVAEWVQDRFLPRYPLTELPQLDPVQERTPFGIDPGERVIRGGFFDGTALTLRAAGRTRAPQDQVRQNVGFRCARSDRTENHP